MMMSRLRRYRGPLIIAGFCAWAVLIGGIHLRLQSGPRSLKGATELLDIGALPVT